MAVCGPPIAYARRVALRGAYHLSVHRGQIVATIWPRPHLARPRKSELERREWMRVTNALVKRMDPETWRVIQDQVGNTSTLARDFAMMMIAGTAFSIRRADGRELLPLRFRRLMFEALDALRLRDLALLCRHPDRWRAIEQQPAGSVLTSQGPGQPLRWV